MLVVVALEYRQIIALPSGRTIPELTFKAILVGILLSAGINDLKSSLDDIV